jgi:aminoglycoside 3-N-acetyltransferase
VPALRALKRRVRAAQARASRAVEPARRRLVGTLSPGELRDALRDAGVRSGATAMVHVSMNEVARAAPEVDAISLTRVLEELLGEEGTLLVPTFPFLDYELDYVERADGYDVRRTPSQMGLMTEVFRRMPGVTRSLHPTHPVAGRGPRAHELLGDHHRGETFAETSPFVRLAGAGGIVVGIGVGLGTFTIMHAAEYLHPGAREFAFEAWPRTMTVTAPQETFDYEFHPLRPRVDRDVRGLARRLRRDGTLRQRRHAGLLVAVTPVARFFERTRAEIDAGRYYRSPGAP